MASVAGVGQGKASRRNGGHGGILIAQSFVVRTWEVSKEKAEK